MNIYEVSGATVAAGAGAAYVELQAVGRPFDLLELGIFVNAATASAVILGRPGNTPAGGTLTVATLPSPQGPNAVASGGGFTTTWTTAPTAPSAGNSHRRILLPATVAAGVVWAWNPGEMVVGTTRTSSLVLWNYGGGAGSVLNFYMKFAE